ncbi:MAG: hypothetical protein CL878_06355 [Dehalococcoidia bacterium]|nr:hypothetical protein [Dehalococcoidia bacterium]
MASGDPSWGSRRLYRSRGERMLAGVSGGLAEYFHIDPVLIRLLFVVTTVAGGGGLLAYIILGIVVPEEPREVSDEPTGDLPRSAAEIPPIPPTWADDRQTVRHRQRAAGYILLAIGVIFLLANFNIFDWGSFWQVWPILLVAGGVILLLRRNGSGKGIFK